MLCPKPGGSQDSPEDAVGGSQHPLRVDEGAPTDVRPRGPAIVVLPQADLPRPLPLGGVVAAHDAHQLILWEGCWASKVGAQADRAPAPGAQPCRPHSGLLRAEGAGPGQVDSHEAPQGREGWPGVRTHLGSQQRHPPAKRGSGMAASASVGGRGAGAQALGPGLERPGCPQAREGQGLTVPGLPCSALGASRAPLSFAHRKWAGSSGSPLRGRGGQFGVGGPGGGCPCRSHPALPR